MLIPRHLPQPDRQKTLSQNLQSVRSPDREPLKSLSTSGIDLTVVNTAPAENLTVYERRLGWAQKGAAAAVSAFDTLGTAALATGGAFLGGAVMGPLGAVAGAAVGGLSGTFALIYGSSFDHLFPYQKTVAPVHTAVAKVGARVGAALSAPLQKLFPKAVKEYQLTGAASTHTVSKSDQERFEAQLQPGDVLVSLSEGDPFFHTLISLKSTPIQHTHAMLYRGGGEVIEASAEAGKVRVNSTADAFDGVSHLVAIRPNYDSPEKAQRVVEKAESYLGRDYDWYASMSDKRLGCVEVPYHSLAGEAPEHNVAQTNVLGLRNFVFPQDYLEMPHSQVIAEAGFARPTSEMGNSRWFSIAQQAAQLSA